MVSTNNALLLLVLQIGLSYMLKWVPKITQADKTTTEELENSIKGNTCENTWKSACDKWHFWQHRRFGTLPTIFGKVKYQFESLPSCNTL